MCGNFNGNMKDDFETRSRYVASSELEFVNSWKESPLCGDMRFVADPCSLNAFRRSWAERKCSIINSQTFAACHSKVGTGQRAVRLLLHRCPVGVGGGGGWALSRPRWESQARFSLHGIPDQPDQGAERFRPSA